MPVHGEPQPLLKRSGSVPDSTNGIFIAVGINQVGATCRSSVLVGEWPRHFRAAP